MQKQKRRKRRFVKRRSRNTKTHLSVNIAERSTRSRRKRNAEYLRQTWPPIHPIGSPSKTPRKPSGL
jgi:hypothetical protein